MEVSEGELKRASEIAQKVDMATLFSVVTSFMRVLGEFAERMGTIEKENPESYEAIMFFGRMAPQIMEVLAEKSPPEEIGAFIKLTSKLIALGPKLDKIGELPAEEKISVGKELKHIADEYDRLWKELQKKMEG